jgi:putative hydrolase of the HAD superfamily
MKSTAKEVESAPSAPDLRGVDAWIFDLDHTLYTVDATRQAQMEERICRYVQRHFNLERDAAWEIQKGYLRDHGSTLAGLIRNHHIDPDAYHDEINDIEELGLTPGAQLRSGLARLPGRRFIFTNNCGRFALNVVTRLGIADLFAGIIDVKAMDFVLKPHQKAFETLFAAGGIAPERAVLFDDSPRNLVAAHALGMKTVWFNNGLGLSQLKVERPELHIDYQTDDLAAFLHAIRI